jgi:hypothetical protein
MTTMIQRCNAISIFLLIALVPLVAFSQEKFDVIHLKSGGKIVGKILEKSENQPIRVELHSKEIMEIPWNTITDIDSVSSSSKNQSASSPASPITYIPAKSSYARDTSWIISLKNGLIKSNVALDSMKGSVLFVSNHAIVDTIDIGSITQLKLEHKSNAAIYAGCGAVVGGIIGGAIAAANSDQKKDALGLSALGNGLQTLAGIGTGGLIGLVVGYFVGLTQSGYNIDIDMPKNNLIGSENLIYTLFQN